MDEITNTPDPPYYAAIFTSVRTEEDEVGYRQMANKMEELATSQPGYLGFESVRNKERKGISVSYWKDAESIRRWKEHVDHLGAKIIGKERWYQSYMLRIAKVEHVYGYKKSDRHDT